MSRVWVQRGAIVAIWVGAIIAWQRYQSSTGSGTLETAQRFIDEVDAMWWGPVAFVVAYLARPLLLFPASLMTVVAGVLFGPVGGVLLVIIGANGSALIAYAVGRSLASPSVSSDDDGAMATSDVVGEDERAGLIARWGRRLRERSFESVFLMRLLFLPYDLVNYVSGALRIRWTSFLLATVLGTLPGTISFVLLGASLERVDMGFDGINAWAIVASVVIFVVSLGIARVLRARTPATTDEQHTGPSASADVAVRTDPATLTPPS
ncbi:MAG: VTT domain-containing protein [Actinomycetota bacterium]